MRNQYKMDTLYISLLLLASQTSCEPSRWSRQIGSYTSDLSDWVPLTRPIEKPQERPQIKRQAVAQPRILTEPFPGFGRPTGFSQNEFPGFFQNQGRPLYLQSVPSVPTASQNYLTDQGFGQQNIRLALGTPNFPLSQGFVAPHSFESPQPQIQRFPQNTVKFEPFPKPGPPQGHLQQKIPPPPPQPPTLPPPKQVQSLQPPPKRPEQTKFIDGYRLENASRDFFATKRPQSLQKLKFESAQQFNTFNQRNEKSPEIFPARPSRPNSNVEREEVQLLYVPVESLNRGQFNYKPVPSAQNVNRDLFSSPGIQRPDTFGQFGNTFKPQNLRPQQGFPGASQEYLNSFNSQKFAPQPAPQLAQLPQIPQFGTSPTSSPFQTIATTPKPKKLKPHQPPLAVFMSQETNKAENIKVADVLTTLKSAKNIAVLDSVSPVNSPKVFIGPSSLSPPDNYVKFELPYLSNLENTDRKLRQLPFFVAPLSYNTPDGFAKIPFPSPHVGSVIVNSLLKDSNSNQFGTSTPFADVFPNSYTGAPQNFFSGQKQTPFSNSVTTKPTFSYFSTSPPKVPQQQSGFNSNFFSLEPQSVTSIKPPSDSTPNLPTPPVIPPFFPSFPSVPHFMDYTHSQQINQQVKQQSTAPPPETTSYEKPIDFQKLRKPDRPLTLPPTTPTPSTIPTSKAPATFPNYLLETHNPFSINQAFDFSSPLDVNVFEEHKKDFVTPSFATPPTRKIPSLQSELSTQKDIKPSSPSYLQNYSPEIHYRTEGLGGRFPSFDISTFPSSSEASSTENQTPSPPNPADFTSQKFEDTQSPNPEYSFTTRAPSSYEEYSSNKDITPTVDNAAESTSTTTTTTRRPPRTRGRPRYTTPKPSDSNESSSRAPVTRKPVRRPLPPRNRYEGTKASTERPTSTKRQPEGTTESSAYKASRTRTRGRNHYKPSDDEDGEFKKPKSKTEKADLAYQRDVLHQNYPVTLMERTSTVDIEAITSPSSGISSTRLFNQGPSYETYSQEETYVTEQPSHYSTEDKSPIKEVEPPTYTSRSTSVQTETPYVPNFSATINEQPSFHSRSSTRQYEEQHFEPRPTNPRFEQSAYVPRSSTSQIRTETTESIPVSTEAVRSSSYSSQYSDYDLKKKDVPSQSEEESTTVANTYEISKVNNQVQLSENNSLNEEQNTESGQVSEVNNIPQRNIKPKIRNRGSLVPGRQQSVFSTTEPVTTQSSAPHKVARLEIKRRPVNPVTYRPTFNRRTTMRIEEIESELKTKQVHSRPDDIPENRHPVYKPEPITEPSLTTQKAKKISQYRRRLPSRVTQTAFAGTTATAETPAAAAKKPSYETKSRFRGRRPTTEKGVQTSQEESTITSSQKPITYNRYNQRTRLSERYNRKPATTESPEENDNEQDADYSIHRPKVVPYEENSGEESQWFADQSANSFRPYNPNDIQEISKLTEPRNKDINNSDEMDIITARNDYDDILLTVTPASNRLQKKISDIPPTLEAFVEQSKTTTGEGSDAISTIETVIEEMMKSLEEKDEDEYTRNVMKHEGGEIGEIPPEKVISSEENEKRQQIVEKETTPDAAVSQESPQNSEETGKVRRRGYWKRVRVSPVTTESFEVAESQFYSNTVNHIGEGVKPSRVIPDKHLKEPVSFIPSEVNDDSEESTTIVPDIPEELEITKINRPAPIIDDSHESKDDLKIETPTTEANPGDVDLGTGTPDPTIMDMIYSQTTETSADQGLDILESTRKDINGVMDYLFGLTTGDDESTEDTPVTKEETKVNATESVKQADVTEKGTTIDVKKEFTTESAYIPSEITETTDEDKETEELLAAFESIKEVKKEEAKPEEISTAEIHKELQAAVEVQKDIQTTSESSIWDSVSTSMSTEVSHETEICFRGKCIKTKKELV